MSDALLDSLLSAIAPTEQVTLDQVGGLRVLVRIATPAGRIEGELVTAEEFITGAVADVTRTELPAIDLAGDDDWVHLDRVTYDDDLHTLDSGAPLGGARVRRDAIVSLHVIGIDRRPV